MEGGSETIADALSVRGCTTHVPCGFKKIRKVCEVVFSSSRRHPLAWVPEPFVHLGENIFRKACIMPTGSSQGSSGDGPQSPIGQMSSTGLCETSPLDAPSPLRERAVHGRAWRACPLHARPTLAGPARSTEDAPSPVVETSSRKIRRAGRPNGTSRRHLHGRRAARASPTLARAPLGWSQYLGTVGSTRDA